MVNANSIKSHIKTEQDKAQQKYEYIYIFPDV